MQVLRAHLNYFVHMPERHDMVYSMPHQFVEQFGNKVKVIIDCFELFFEKPLNPLALGQTLGQFVFTVQYKQTHHGLAFVHKAISVLFQRAGVGGEPATN